MDQFEPKPFQAPIVNSPEVILVEQNGILEAAELRLKTSINRLKDSGQLTEEVIRYGDNTERNSRLATRARLANSMAKKKKGFSSGQISEILEDEEKLLLEHRKKEATASNQ